MKYVSTTVSKRREGYTSEYIHLEDYNYTKVKSARVFNKDVRYEVDLEVAFPMEDSIREDNVAYSYSYTTIYDVAVVQYLITLGRDLKYCWKRWLTMSTATILKPKSQSYH